MDPQDLLLTALRASLIYFFLLIIVRVLGKREVGSSTAFDLIVALMLGELVDEAIYDSHLDDVSMAQGALAIVVIAAWHYLNSWGSFRSKFIHRLTSEEPTVIIENSEIIPPALSKERMNPEDVFAEMRLQGIDDISEVKLATLEPSGQVSILQKEWSKTIQKEDLFSEMAQASGKTMKASKQEIADTNKKIQQPDQKIREGQ